MRQGVIWEEIELYPSGTPKGVQIKAKLDLPKDLCIPYGGVYRTPYETRAIAKHNNEKVERRNSHGAAYEGRAFDGTKEWGMADAHPIVLQERGYPTGSWPGGYCNQAETPDEQNAELFQHDGEVCKAPAYEYMDDRCRKLFVRTTRPVQQGEEILIDYGYHPHRQTKWGFGPKAKKPAFKANYNLRAKGVKRKNNGD